MTRDISDILHTDSDSRFFTVSVDADLTETDGVERDSDGSYNVSWDDVNVLDADDLPPRYKRQFDADEFYAFDATVARPIEQQYVINDEEWTFKKPASELARSAWSLDNRPWTLGHPETGSVRSYDDIHGAWTNPRWVEDSQDLDATLVFPTNDTEAIDYVSDHGDVSVGFTHSLDAEGVEEDDVDAYQRELYYDHVASVQKGRCPSEEGCGLHTDSAKDAFRMMRAEGVSHVDGGSVVSSPVATDDDAVTDTTDSTIMCDSCDGFDLDVSDFTVDTVRSRHEGIDAALSEKDERIEELQDSIENQSDAADTLSEVRETLDVDEDADLVESADSLVSDLEELRQFREDQREGEREEMVDFLADHGHEVEEDTAFETVEQTYETVRTTVDSLDVESNSDEDAETSPTTANRSSATDSSVGTTRKVFNPLEVGE